MFAEAKQREVSLIVHKPRAERIATSEAGFKMYELLHVLYDV